MSVSAYPLLNRIDSPSDLKGLSSIELGRLADEIRSFLIESVSRTGGHLSSSLGVVELTLALHTVFDTPRDRIVWDVGHQTYPHKILTGRRDAMDSLRQRGGLSGFLHRHESDYDAFGAGHASTSISAALGMAVAAAREGTGRKSVAVIGDGAMTGGMAFEALNNGGTEDCDLLVILNDNEMSISPSLGALRNYLARLMSGRVYTGMRDTSKHVLELLPGASEFARRWEEHMKGMVMPGTLFEELGFNYIGPVDGHDLPALMATLRNMHDLQGCRLLHVITQKGRGYSPAERDPCNYHGVKPFDLDSAPATVASPTATTSPAPQSYSDVFGDWVCDMANIDERLLAITPAMCEGSGLTRFRDEFPDRYFDVGIAEQHAVTFAAGLACENYKPVVAIYSTFLQRAYDQLVHDVALQNLDVTFAIDRAGLVGADGATHAGTLDISFMRCIPNLILMAPSDQNECRRMLATAYLHQGPAAVRYPRGAGPVAEVDEGLTPLPLGRARVRRRGTKAALLVFGTLLDEALQAAEVMDVTVVDMRFIKPLDKDCIVGMAESHEVLVTVEDNVIAGGAGAAVSECLSDRRVVCPVFHLGLPDRFIAHATREQQLRECGIDAGGIEARLRDILGRVTNHVIAGDVMDPDRFWSS